MLKLSRVYVSGQVRPKSPDTVYEHNKLRILAMKRFVNNYTLDWLVQYVTRS